MQRSQRVDWFYRAQWGLFMHFLAETQGIDYRNWGEDAIAAWNRKVEAFDVEKLAAQLHELQVGYFYLTLGQNSGYFCSPNAELDRITGRDAQTSRCSRRDLPAELYRALKKYNIPLLVYLPSHAPMHDVNVTLALRGVPPWSCDMWSPTPEALAAMTSASEADSRIKIFQRHWEAVIREWSLRWGEKVRGWWFDGCYYSDRLYQFPNEPNFTSFAAAARAGNPNSLVCWNPGVVYPPQSISAEEDYTSGETNEPEQTHCHGRWLDQAQNHVLSYLGIYWGNSPVRFSPARLTAITRQIVDDGGVITWDVPFDRQDGTLTTEVMDALRDLSRQFPSERQCNFPPSPLIRFQNIRPLTRKQDRGEIELRLDNALDEAIAGSVELNLTPAEMFAPLNPLDFKLEPGAWQQRQIELFRLSVNFTGRLYGMLETTSAGIRQIFRFPAGWSWEHPKLAQRYPIIAATGETLGSVGIEVQGEHLLIAGTIADPNPVVKATPWQGSGLEVFLMPGRDFSRMAQVFMTPTVSGLEAAVLMGTQAYLPLPGAAIETTATSEGYIIAAKLPLSVIGAPGEFALEMQLSVSRPTVEHPDDYLRATLCGSSSAFMSPEFYCDVLV